MSSVIPEVVLQRVLAGGFRALRKDPRIIDSVLKGIDQRNMSRMKKFVLEEEIDFALNYPKTDSLKVPALVLVLKSENEAQTFLGDRLGEYPRYDTPDPDLDIDVLGSGLTGASVSNMSGMNRAVVQGLKVVRSYDTLEAGVSIHKVVLVDTDENLAEYYYALRAGAIPAVKLHVVSGTGEGQVLDISAIEDNVLDVAGVFSPYLDDTSIVDIRLARDTTKAVGEPSRVYEPHAGLIRTGANMDATYQLAILTGSPDETLWLSRIVKAILFSQKVFMESQGLMNLKISAGDFINRGDDFGPSEIFQKVITLTFTYEFSFVEERDDLVDFTQIDLAVATMFDPRCVLTGLSVVVEGEED